MSEPPRSYETRDGGPPRRIPAWVKVLGIASAVVAVLVAVMFVVLGGDHGGGPGRHF